MVDDFMLDDGIIKNKGHLGADILNNIIKNLSIVDEAIEEACHEINKHDELYEMHFESFENDIQDFNKFRWEYEDFTSYADEYDAMVDSNYKSRMESICEQLSDIRLENITIDNNLGIIDKQGSHYDTFGGTRLKHKINIEDVLGVDSVNKAMKADYEERRQIVQVMQKMVNEDNWPEGMSEDKKEAIRQYVSNLNGGKMESYDDKIKNLLTKGEFNFITDREQNLSLALDFVPIVGDIKGVIEAIKGKEMITNRELSDGEKTMAGISSAVGFIPGVGGIGSIAKVGEKLGAKTVIKEAAKYTVKETVKGAGMYGVSSIASDLRITPRQQIMAMGGFSLYKGGKAVLKNPKVISAVNNTVDITKATVKDAIESNKGSAILSSNLGGYGGQLYNSLKKVTAERKALREGIASGESSISRVSGNINNIKLRNVNERLSELTKEQLKGKPKNSPNPSKWFKKNGTISIDEKGIWTYHDWEGNSVSYPDGYPDFKTAKLVIQEVNIGKFEGYNKDFANADKLAPNGAIPETSTWHHHQDGQTLQEIITKLHERFRHRGGMSKLKKIKE